MLSVSVEILLLVEPLAQGTHDFRPLATPFAMQADTISPKNTSVSLLNAFLLQLIESIHPLLFADSATTFVVNNGLHSIVVLVRS